MKRSHALAFDSRPPGEGEPLRKARKWGELHIDPQQREAPAEWRGENLNDEFPIAEQNPSVDDAEMKDTVLEGDNMSIRPARPTASREERRARSEAVKSDVEESRRNRRKTAKMPVYKRRSERDQRRARAREDAVQLRQRRKSAQAPASSTWTRSCIIS